MAARMRERPILITGCARSGTSLTAGLIDTCGVFGGKTIGPCAANKKGMFEHPKIRNIVIKSYLLRAGYDMSGQKPLPNIYNLPPFPEIKRCMLKLLRKDGYTKGPWYYKGAKMCLIWPILHNAFPEARWIVCRRSDDGITNSCVKTQFMKAYGQDKEGWQGWVDEHKKRFKEMELAGLDMKYMWPSKLMEGDWSEFEDIAGWLGLDYDDKKVKEFIDPALWTAEKVKV